jgi:hypothetical protein
MSCGVTETMYGNAVAGTVNGLYKIGPDAGAAAVAMRQLPMMRGGCGCMGGKPPKNTLRGGYGGCTGQPMMLKALGIMNGGKRNASSKRNTSNKRNASSKRKTIRKRGGACGCSLGKLIRGGYKPTAKDRAALRKFRAGKSIGFTMRSSLKAKGLIPRANGTKRVSNKYK